MLLDINFFLIIIFSRQLSKTGIIYSAGYWLKLFKFEPYAQIDDGFDDSEETSLSWNSVMHKFE